MTTSPNAVNGEKIFDFAAIGIGPFNLGLACLTSTIDDLNGIFLDQAAKFDWHPGMMLENAHLQTPFLADLVTLADPSHPLSFLNYLKTQGKLYAFYIRENFFLLRKEFNQYCQWACTQLDNLLFNHCVKRIDWDNTRGCFRIHAEHENGQWRKILAKRLVLGTGPTPTIPNGCESLIKQSHQISHSADYLHKKTDVQQQKQLTVLGSGQSAAEIFYDLLQDNANKQYHINWITRSARFSPLEYTKLTLEMTSPEYVDYFHALSTEKRKQLLAQQQFLYKGINADLINDIFDLIYTRQLDGAVPARIMANTELKEAKLNTEGQLQLELRQIEIEQNFQMNTDHLILATGYQYQVPAFMQPLSQHIQCDEDGRYQVQRNYSIDLHERIFVQNAELHTHGLSSPDLGMACYRNSCIIREILGREFYSVEKRIAFQDFSPPASLLCENLSDQRPKTKVLSQ